MKWILKELLRKALAYTNEVTLLSSCFQRGSGSVVSCGNRLLYEDAKLEISIKETPWVLNPKELFKLLMINR